jgi:hypothetical protein
MRALLGRRCAPRYPELWAAWIVVLAVTVSATFTSAADRSTRGTSEAPEAVEFFAAVDAKQIAARFIPRDSRRATIWIENKTDKPLSIRMPAAFGGAPVLAQAGAGFFGPPGGIGGGGGGGGAAPQRVGFPGNAFPGMFDVGGPGGGGHAGPGGMPGGGGGAGFFNVPAGKTIKTKVPCVCLEHGKPDPKPRVPYEVVRIESICDKPELAELLTTLGTGRGNQRVVQAAAWHLANDMSWERLDALNIKRITGLRQRWFHPAEIQAAKQLVARLPSVKAREEGRKPKSDSLASH